MRKDRILLRALTLVVPISSLGLDSTQGFVCNFQDTETILWDVVGQTSVCRFKGHKSPVTDCHFMQQHPYLVTCSKDSLVKVWDLQTLRCCSTLVGHKSEVRGIDLWKILDG